MGLRDNFGRNDCGIQSSDPHFRETVETEINSNSLLTGTKFPFP